jgi:hypothetical protein
MLNVRSIFNRGLKIPSNNCNSRFNLHLKQDLIRSKKLLHVIGDQDMDWSSWT